MSRSCFRTARPGGDPGEIEAASSRECRAQPRRDRCARSSADVRPEPRQKATYTTVLGLGSVTWEYFLMLLGIPGVKADVHIRRFVERATGDEVSAGRARDLVKELARTIEVDATAADVLAQGRVAETGAKAPSTGTGLAE